MKTNYCLVGLSKKKGGEDFKTRQNQCVLWFSQTCGFAALPGENQQCKRLTEVFQRAFLVALFVF